MLVCYTGLHYQSYSVTWTDTVVVSTHINTDRGQVFTFHSTILPASPLSCYLINLPSPRHVIPDTVAHLSPVFTSGGAERCREGARLSPLTPCTTYTHNDTFHTNLP